jgi:ATP-dependent RNA helicase DHX37/DHR1
LCRELCEAEGWWERPFTVLDSCEPTQRIQAMEEIHKLRGQISKIVQANFSDADIGLLQKIDPPNAFQVCLPTSYDFRQNVDSCSLLPQVKVLRQLLTAAFIDQVAIRKDLLEEATGNKFSSSKGVPYRTIGIEEDVFIHPSSVLYSASPPQYLVYHEVVRSNQVWIQGDIVRQSRGSTSS